jgi:hypothetical protein
MKLTRQNLGNIAIVALAAILFGGFVFLATKGGDKDNSDLATVAPTSTTERVTTTTEPETTTTPSTLALETTTAPVTSTTVKATTTTVKKVTTTTAHGACAHGIATENTDNKNTFQYGPTGWISGSSSDQPNSSTFPLKFTIATEAGTDNRIRFAVTLQNNSACTATFGDNLVVAITLQAPSGGDPQTFTMAPDDQHKVQDIKAGETITLKQERAEPGSGTFEATGACDINYG